MTKEIEIQRAVEADAPYIKEKLKKYILSGDGANWK